MKLQVLELPITPEGDYPFALILSSQTDEEYRMLLRSDVEKVKADMGARCVLIFPNEVEIVR
jgi:hypothetical protein